MRLSKPHRAKIHHKTSKEMKEEIEELEKLIHAIEREIQNGLLHDDDFCKTKRGKELLDDISRFSEIRKEIAEEIGSANDSDRLVRNERIFDKFTPCELGECSYECSCRRD